jgi:predicted outer membrane lipoprotein
MKVQDSKKLYGVLNAYAHNKMKMQDSNKLYGVLNAYAHNKMKMQDSKKLYGVLNAYAHNKMKMHDSKKHYGGREANHLATHCPPDRSSIDTTVSKAAPTGRRTTTASPTASVVVELSIAIACGGDRDAIAEPKARVSLTRLSGIRPDEFGGTLRIRLDPRPTVSM